MDAALKAVRAHAQAVDLEARTRRQLGAEVRDLTFRCRRETLPQRRHSTAAERGDVSERVESAALVRHPDRLASVDLHVRRFVAPRGMTDDRERKPGAEKGAELSLSDLSVLAYARSEEHTSELQSLAYLVCRL